MSDLTGQTISHYQILEQIGQGGMAVVYKAHDTRLDAEVAIKLIRRGSFPQDAYHRVIQRFEREAKSLARLNHPNIVSILDYGEYDSAPYLVMKFMPGGTLRKCLGKPMDYKEAARLLLPIARALAHAHQRGTLHRDVKPSNILLTDDGEPMLADFGIAKILEEGDGQTLTGFGVGIGTPEYMAPEQWLGKGVDGRADVYSLGVVFYELVTGCKPYLADTPGQLMDQHLHSPLPNLRKIVPGLPLVVERLLSKALAKQPQDRYPDMNSLAIALEGLLALPTPGKRAKPAQKQTTHREAITSRKPQSAQSAEDKNLTFDEISEDKPNVKPGSSLPWKKLGIGLATLAVLGVLIWLVGRKIIPPIIDDVRLSRTTGTSIAATQAESAQLTEIAVAWTKTNTPTPNPTVTRTPTLTLTPAVTNTITLTPTSTLIPPDCTEIGQEWVSPVDGMKLMCVPAGKFTMGSNGGGEDGQPEHEVFLGAFRIDQTGATGREPGGMAID